MANEYHLLADFWLSSNNYGDVECYSYQY